MISRRLHVIWDDPVSRSSSFKKNDFPALEYENLTLVETIIGYNLRSVYCQCHPGDIYVYNYVYIYWYDLVCNYVYIYIYMCVYFTNVTRHSISNL